MASAEIPEDHVRTELSPIVQLVKEIQASRKNVYSTRDESDAILADQSLEELRQKLENGPADERYSPPTVLPREAGRLSALRSYVNLEDAPDTAFSSIVSMVAEITDCPIALISLVESQRQWFKSRIGLKAAETPRCVSFCAHAIHNPNEVFVVEDATKDPRFARNPLVTGYPDIRFYAGQPLLNSDNYALGTLCIIDTKPRKLLPMHGRVLKQLAQLAMGQMELHRSMLRLALEARLSERLLQGVMPSSVAQRLKMMPEGVIADRHTGVTVLFVDIVGFTSFAGQICASQLVRTLSHVFQLWDTLLLRHGLCKIKSIGDAFLVCGGLPYDSKVRQLRTPTRKARRSLSAPQMCPTEIIEARNNRMIKGARACMGFALDLLHWQKTFNDELNQDFKVRIGMNTGEVVAGVLGSQSVAFDIWGDSVNTASRVEGLAANNGIVVTNRTHALLKGVCKFGNTFTKDIKGKGPTVLWEVDVDETVKKYNTKRSLRLSTATNDAEMNRMIASIKLQEDIIEITNQDVDVDEDVDVDSLVDTDDEETDEESPKKDNSSYDGEPNTEEEDEGLLLVEVRPRAQFVTKCPRHRPVP